MKKKNVFSLRYPLIASWLLLMHFTSGAQVANPYYLNGSATQDNCNCYTLTPDAFTKSGSVWNIYKISLKDPFEFNFSVYLGATDANGADGIVFTLQPISTQVGSTGGGLGFEGVKPSVGITIDTWQNDIHQDPSFDHIAIQRDGDLSHNSSNNLSGPVTALAGNSNIEDGRWHLLTISWDPSSKVLKASMDGSERVSTTIDLISSVFNNDPMVFWGFTASTGGAKNLQRFCTALNPGIKTLSDQETCFGKPITFRDSSSSFGKIVKWFWDLGDGTKDTLQNPPPHLYAAPGIYTVKLNILGNDGCLSDTLKQDVVVGSDPFAKIKWKPDPVCENASLQLLDSSLVKYGTVNQWNWNAGGVTYTTKDPVIPGGLPAGINRVSLNVRTKEGCISPVETVQINVLPMPVVELSADKKDICAGGSTTLTGFNRTPSLTVDRWLWSLGDGRADSSGQTITPSYANTGHYRFSLQARASNGCLSSVKDDSVHVYSTNAFAGNDTTIAAGLPFRLNGTGGVSYSWSPPFGLSNPNIADPVVTLDTEMEYELTAFSPAGCETKDRIRLKVFKGPEIYVPTAFTPNGDGLNDVLKVLPIGVALNYFRVFDSWGNLVFATGDQNIGWDGTQRNKPMPAGIYVWMTAGTESGGRTLFKKGTLQLIR